MATEKKIPYSVSSVVYKFLYGKTSNYPTFNSSHENILATGDKNVSLNG